MKKVFLIFVFAALLLLPQSVASATEAKGGPTLQSFDYLGKCTSQLSVNSNDTISARGETTAYTTVQKISVTTYLERQNSDGTWSVVKSWGAYNNNSSKVTVSGTSGTLSPGAYRVRSYHRIDHNGTIETTTSYSGTDTIN